MAASAATPSMVLRSDAAVALPLLSQLPALLGAAPHARYLNGPFSELLDDAGVTDRFVRAWADYLAFALSGLDARGTLGAACAYTLGDLYPEGAVLDYPVGGSGAVIDALVRGVTKHGGTVRLGARVDEILLDGEGRAVGVRLKCGEAVRARRAVVSNADAWATAALLPSSARPAARSGAGGALNAGMDATPSFMHLHLGIRADGLPAGLGIHYSVVLGPFDDIERERSMVIISIPTLLDPSMAPDGRHVVHAYYAANEPYELWAGLERNSDEYARLKEERARPLWEALETIIPDIRERVEVEMVASPLTHERFLSRTRGTYGPPLFASDGSTIPYAKTPIDGLLHCGDSTFPGIGVPSAAASGMNAANTLVSPWKQLELMRELDDMGCLKPV
jgi:phytoene dehydrogenase-like protein